MEENPKVSVYTVYDPVRYHRPGKHRPELCSQFFPVSTGAAKGHISNRYTMRSPEKILDCGGLVSAGPQISQINSCSGLNDFLLYRMDIYNLYGNILPVEVLSGCTFSKHKLAECCSLDRTVSIPEKELRPLLLEDSCIFLHLSFGSFTHVLSRLPPAPAL